MNIEIIDPNKFNDIFLTQSKNVSAKLALCTDELLRNIIEYNTHKNHDWNQMKDVVMHTMYEAFVFRGQCYFVRMFDTLISQLIPTGIMNYLVENHYNYKWKFGNVDEGPKVLSIDDLLFGFNIWFGCCCISSLVFIIEKCNRLRKGYRKVKFDKVHPMKIKNCKIAARKRKLSSDLNKMFKIQKQVDRNFGGLDFDASEFDSTLIDEIETENPQNLNINCGNLVNQNLMNK